MERGQNDFVPNTEHPITAKNEELGAPYLMSRVPLRYETRAISAHEDTRDKNTHCKTAIKRIEGRHDKKIKNAYLLRILFVPILGMVFDAVDVLVAFLTAGNGARVRLLFTVLRHSGI